VATEKPIDERIKEAQLAKLKAEEQKARQEAVYFRNQTYAKWYSGKSLAQIVAGVLTVVALYTALDTIFLKPARESESKLVEVNTFLAKARLDSLKAEKHRIAATIDSLRVRSIIMAGFGDLGNLGYTNVLEKYKMINAKNYYDRHLNPNGEGVNHKFELQDDSLVYDAATGLTWQRWGSSEALRTFEKAQNYIAQINRDKFGGHSDWRLPTLDEAMSLMEPEAQRDEMAITSKGLHIAALFGKEQQWIWTADKYTISQAWYVDFFNGVCSNSPYTYIFVRAVRQGQSL